MKYFLLLFLCINIYAQDSLYFFPKDAKAAQQKIQKLIQNSQDSIDIAMYNFGHKKFAKLLDKAQKNGVKVTLFCDKKNITFKNIKSKKTEQKLHTKIAIFDKKIVVFGSPNWTKKSFKANYEVLYITDDKKVVSEFNDFFKKLH